MNDQTKNIAIASGGVWRGGYAQQPSGDSVYEERHSINPVDLDIELFAKRIRDDERSMMGGPVQPEPVQQEPKLPEFYAAIEYDNPGWDVVVAVYQRREDSTPLLVYRGNLPNQQPAQQQVPVSRTDRQIVDETEKLAVWLLSWSFNHQSESKTPMRESTHPFAKSCWAAACHIQEMLTATDPENAVAELDEGTGPHQQAESHTQQEPAKRQYYHQVNRCTAEDSKSKDCICWHDEGTGPRANEPEFIRSWRAKP